MVDEIRAGEVRTLLATPRGWAQGRPGVVAVGLVGSWAYGGARMSSNDIRERIEEVRDEGLAGVEAA